MQKIEKGLTIIFPLNQSMLPSREQFFLRRNGSQDDWLMVIGAFRFPQLKYSIRGNKENTGVIKEQKF